MDEIKIKKAVGDIIKEYRVNMNLTQVNLGKMIGITQRQITLIETGKSFPSLATMIKFAKVFKCNIKDFFDF